MHEGQTVNAVAEPRQIDIESSVRSILAMRSDDALAGAVAYFDTPEKIEALERAMLEYEQAETPVEHYFCAGVYARKVVIPAGTFAIGHAHRHDCINIVLTGSASVLVDGRVKRITAPAVFVGKAMDRKVGYVHEEASWVTVHSTELTDIPDVEDKLLVKSAAYREFEERIRNGGVARKIANSTTRSDYLDVIASIGMTEREVRAQVENSGDQICMPDEFFGRTVVAPSRIHGLGLFAARAFKPHELIAPARIGAMRTPVGRYANHSDTPNCAMVAHGSDIVLVSTEPVSIGSELTVDYRVSISSALKAKN